MRYNNSILKAARKLNIEQNVSLQVIDAVTGQVVQEHTGHNSATNSLLFGIAHHLIGDFLPNEKHGLHPAYNMLSNYVPRYISLGTMGLINQKQDSHGLPAGIGESIPDIDNPTYRELLEAYNQAVEDLAAAKEALANDCQYWPACDACAECETCATRIGDKKQAIEDAQNRVTETYDALMSFSEEARFTEYMEKRPGYGADGYDYNENNGRQYFGLGYAFSSYDNSEQYFRGDKTTFKGLVYECIQDTPNPSGALDLNYWKVADDIYQPSLGTTIKMELISPSFPRESISYRDVVPEYEAESPRTIDVVFSAMISTGALAQFRPDGQDYIFITEAGLWSKKTWEDTSENGLLAGYRIVPPNQNNWDMSKPENRQILKQNVLKVGRNQVVQVVWKIQLIADDTYLNDEPEPVPIPNYPVYIWSKTYDDEEPLEGVTFVVAYDSLGANLVRDPVTGELIRWTSSIVSHQIHLEDGEYYLVPLEPAPDYELPATIHFQIEEGVVTDLDTQEVLGDTITVLSVAEVQVVSLTSESISRLATLYSSHTTSGSILHFNRLFSYDSPEADELRNREVNPIDLTENQCFAWEFPGAPDHESGYAGMEQYDHPYSSNTRSRSSNNVPQYEDPTQMWPRIFDLSIEQFKELAPQYDDGVYATTSAAYPMYLFDGYYYCDKQLQFSDKNNFDSLVTALCRTAHSGIGNRNLSFRNWDTSQLQSLSGAFDEAVHYLNFLDLTGWDTSNVTNLDNAFKGCIGMADIFGLEGWDVSSVTSLRYTFDECICEDHYTATTVRADNYKEYMQGSTGSCIDLTNWDVSNVIDMSWLFCQSLILIPLNWSTPSLTTMVGTFSHSYSLERSLIDSDGPSYQYTYYQDPLLWDTSNVTDMSYMFANCYSGYLDVSDLDTGLVQNMSYMFKECAVFRGVYDPDSGYYEGDALHLPSCGISEWDYANVTNMSHMFDGATISFDTTTKLNTSNVTDMSYMYYNWDYRGDAHIYAPNPPLDTSSVANMSHMFDLNPPRQYARGEIDDVSGFDTSNVTDMSYMFSGCRYVQGFENWDVSSCTNFEEMFKYAFTEEHPFDIDLSNWTFQNDADVTSMFVYAVPDALKLPTSFPINYRTALWGVGGDATVDPMHPNQFYGGVKLHLDNRHISSNEMLSYIKYLLDSPDTQINIPGSINKLVARNWTFDNSITDLSNLFSRWPYLYEIDLSGWDVSHITNFSQMFYKTNSQTGVVYDDIPGVLDYSSLDDWNISAGQTFTQMCSTCLMSNANVAQIQGYYPYEQGYTFPNWGGTWDTTYLRQIQWSSGPDRYTHSASDTLVAKPRSNQFGTFTPVAGVSLTSESISKLATVYDVGDRNTAHFTRIFSSNSPEANELRNRATDPIDLTSNQCFAWEFPGAVDYVPDDMGQYNHPYSSNTRSTDDVPQYEDATEMWPRIFDINVERFKELAIAADGVYPTTSLNNPMYLYDGYYYCDKQLQFSDKANLDAIMTALYKTVRSGSADKGYRDLSFRNWDTSQLQSLANAFVWINNHEINFLDLTGWNVSNVTDMTQTFTNNKGMADIFGLENWNTSNVTSLRYTFAEFIEFDPYFGDYRTRVEDYKQYMYDYKGSRIDLSNWDVSNVTDMSGLFQTSAVLVPMTWNTASLTNMSYTFATSTSINRAEWLDEEPNYQYTYYQTTLRWDTSNVVDMSYMFYSCRTGYPDLSQLDTSSVQNMSYAFSGCAVNRGTYDPESQYTIEGALILPTRGISEWDYSSVTNMSHMFDGATIAFDTEEPLDTSNVVDMSYMFKNNDYQQDAHGDYHNPSLDTSSVTNMSHMFDGYGVFEVDVSGFDTSNVTNLSYMFTKCYRTHGFENWDVSSCTNFREMFSYNHYTSADLSDWTFASNVNVTNMFLYAEPNLIKLPTSFPIKSSGVLASVGRYNSAVNPMHSNLGEGGMVLYLDNIHISSNTMLRYIKNLLVGSGSTLPGSFNKLVARNWTFDESVTDLSNLFSKWYYLYEVDLSGWDVSHITNFSQMFYKLNNGSTIYDNILGVLDYSSLDDWDVSAGQTFTQMCSTCLMDDGQVANVMGKVVFEQGYRFPDWDGTWDTTYLRYIEYDPSPNRYTHAETDTLLAKPRSDTFGTFAPTPPVVGTKEFDWDFAESTIDTLQNRNINKWLEGPFLAKVDEGLKIIGATTYTDVPDGPIYLATHPTSVFDPDIEDWIDVDTELFIADYGYRFEFDFGTVNASANSKTGFFDILSFDWNDLSASSPTNSNTFTLSCNNTRDEYSTYDGTTTFTPSDLSNKTLIITLEWNANDHLIMKVFIDTDLIFETPEYNSANRPFFPIKSDMKTGEYLWYDCRVFKNSFPFHPEAYIIWTNFRIYQLD